MVVRLSYLHNGISYTGKMTALYWIKAQSASTSNSLMKLLHSVDLPALSQSGLVLEWSDELPSCWFLTGRFLLEAWALLPDLSYQTSTWWFVSDECPPVTIFIAGCTFRSAGYCHSQPAGTHFTKQFWAHNPSVAEICVVLIWKLMIRSGHKFACGPEAQLSNHLQNYDLVWSLELYS